MSNIDWSATITAEAAAEAAAEARAAAIKSACATGIAEVLDAATLANIQGAALTGALKGPSMEAFRAAHGWIGAMQAASRAAIATGAAPEWPALPEGVAALAAAY